MPPPLLIDLTQLNRDEVLLAHQQIYELLPHRFEFELLDGLCWLDREGKRLISFVDIGPDAWWARGHVPGRPLLPGVLMLEMAAQTAALGAKLLDGPDSFIGFGGVDACKFRESVSPPARLYILCVGTEFRQRRIVTLAQGVCNDRLVFEAQITGLTLR